MATLLMDAERAKSLFQRRLPAFAPATLQIDRCTILHTRYRTSPEKRRQGKAFLSVCYELEVHDPVRATRGVQLLHVKAYPEGGSRRKFERARRGPRFAPRFGEAVAHLPDLDAVVWAFPNDPKLPHLPEVIDPEAVKRHLPYSGLPAGLDSPARLRGVQVEVVRYKPEVRCTTRYALRGGSLADERPLMLYGKTFGHGRAQEISRRMESLWMRSTADVHQLVVARPLGCSDAVKTVWQEALPGAPLIHVLDAGSHAGLLQAAAAGLARLHRTDVAGLPCRTLADLLAAVRAEAAELAQAFSRQAPRLAAIVSSLERGAGSLEAHPDGLVHGDFLLKQLVFDEGRLGLCDFDNLSIGDPIQDLANFLVDLRFQGFDSSVVEDMEAVFLGSYAARAGRVPPERLRWHRRLQVLRSAHYFYKRRHYVPGFEQELERILDLAGPSGA